ncbi:O-antigen ligase family protein [Asaccharospora irregularis]|uniref:O-antigen ligase n=1 Tax=Asaccharospora irregularis DSM 2635 TaxID=1121321 RepID=A0A1M5PF06_9FIRM|nr:O-antigen ligase family protein [Asaccharospora irregularis]SHH00335.1 O-antigen ligase [Asaccharospora irregularis DSM 2635]
MYFLWIILVQLDPNIYFANSISRIGMIVISLFLLTKKKLVMRYSKGMVLLLATNLIVLLSYLFNGGDLKLIIINFELLLVYYSFYNFIYNSSDFEKKSRQVLNCIMYVGLFLGIVSILEYNNTFNILGLLNLFRTEAGFIFVENDSVRPSSTFNNPIFFASYLVVTFIIASGKILNKFETSKNKIISGITLTVCVLALIISKTEGAVISLIIACIIILLTKYKIKLSFLLRASISFLLVFISFIILGVKNGYFTYQDLTTIFSNRIYTWVTSLRVIIDNFILGVGPGRYNDLFHMYSGDLQQYYYFRYFDPHSDYISVIVSSGVIGLIFFWKFHWYFMKIAIDAFKNLRFRGDLVFFSCSMIVIYFSVHRLVDSLSTYRLLSIIYICLSVFEAYSKRRLLVEGKEAINRCERET